MPDSDELLPQRGISTEVLAERLTNYYQGIQSEFTALHHHLAELIARMDGQASRSELLEDKLHAHEALASHPYALEKLAEYSNRFTNIETKFGQIDTKFKEIDDARLIERTTREAKAKELARVDQLRTILVTSIPVLVLIYSVFFS